MIETSHQKALPIYSLAWALLFYWAHHINGLYCQTLTQGQDESHHTFLKIQTSHKGVHKIRYKDIASFLEISTPIPLKNIRLYKVSKTPKATLGPLSFMQEVAIDMQGNDDGFLNPNEHFLFLGDKTEQAIFVDTLSSKIAFERDLYNLKSVYLLKIENGGQGKGKQIQNLPSTENKSVITKTIDTYGLLFEKNFKTHHIAEKPYKYSSIPSHTSLSFDTKNIDNATHLEFSIKCLSSEDLRFMVSANQKDTSYNTAYFDESLFFFPLKGADSDEISITFKYDQNVKPQLFIDYITLFVKAKMKIKKEGQTLFYTLKENSDAGEQGKFIFESEIPTDGFQLWDITDVLFPKKVPLYRDNNRLFFTHKNKPNSKFILFKESNVYTPEISLFNAPKPKSYADIDFLIICTQDLSQEAKIIQNWKNENGFQAAFITIDEIYRTYSGGFVSPQIISGLISSIYHSHQNRLKYVLFLGDASYKTKNNLDHISLNYSQGIATDDLNLPEEIQVGRIPTSQQTNLDRWINKVKSYPKPGLWQSKMLLVADDYENTWEMNFTRSLGQITQHVEQSSLLLNPEQVFLAAYKKTDKDIAARSALKSKLDRGAAIISFLGHGNQDTWTKERIFTRKDIESISSQSPASIFIALTCEYAKIDDPKLTSGSELLLFKPFGGATATISTTRKISAGLAIAFHKKLFEKLVDMSDRGEELTIGKWLKSTKSEYKGITEEVKNIILLGDPSMKIALPKPGIKITHIDGKERQKEIKQKLIATSQTTSLGGEVASLATSQPLEIQLTGKSPLTTSYDRHLIGAKVSYPPPQGTISKVWVSTKSGQFEDTLLLPKEILSEAGSYRLFITQEYKNMVYAVKEDISLAPNIHAKSDDSPPTLELFLNEKPVAKEGVHTTNVPIYSIGIQSEDDVGININSLGAYQPYLEMKSGDTHKNKVYLTNHHSSIIDYKNKAFFRYNLSEKLFAGKYKIKVVVWDINSNKTEKEIMVTVAKEDEKPFKFSVYPNPFYDTLSFRVIIVKALKSDLHFKIRVFSISGKKLAEEVVTFEQEDFLLQKNNSLEVCKLNLPAYLSEGIYFSVIEVRDDYRLIQKETHKLIKKYE